MIKNDVILTKNDNFNAITFAIEELSPPSDLLPEKNLEEVLSKFSRTVEAAYSIDYTLVENGRHSFLHTVYQAYSEHRPLILSPDMIWLLICQGFASHVNFYSGTSKDVFPTLSRKKLIVQNDKVRLGDPSAPWGEVTSKFCDIISEDVGNEIIEALRADFSTTGTAERIASEITIMDAMKTYYEYIHSICICGIPEITLEGTSEDWEKLLAKTKVLAKYDLSWWTKRLEPLLQEFVNASKNLINKEFWMNIFKVHTADSYGSPKNMDGWLLDFFPYNRLGERIDLRKYQGLSVSSILERLPKQIVSVNFEHRIIYDSGEILAKYPMEYWAGFIGAKQDKTNFALRPEIGWFVTHQPKEETKLKPAKYTPDGIRFYNLTAFPQSLLEREEWFTVCLNFVGKIDVQQFPESIKNVKIYELGLIGQFDLKQKEKLVELFPHTQDIYLNGKEIFRRKE